MSEFPELVSFVKQEAGNYARAVGKFEGIESELQYCRDDLNPATVTNRFELIHDNISWSWSPPEDELDEQLGQKRASLQVRENAVILHLPTGHDEGVLIALEPEAASNLTTFIGTCLEYVPEPESNT
ncbi:hypothetical protein ACFR9U_16240 [Halorientalis brevis]|uniref:Uncharacterized protein n=1 Tax=Halorientalis brevis TaxID=1126241 RepID=A0ABD6CFF3_9EURY|nr:hypothetical protein [Halorientalis brevis]